MNHVKGFTNLKMKLIDNRNKEKVEIKELFMKYYNQKKG